MSYEQLGRLQAAVVWVGDAAMFDYENRDENGLVRRIERSGPVMILTKVEGLSTNVVHLDGFIEQDRAEKAVDTLAS